jgi:hypothetical protein
VAAEGVPAAALTSSFGQLTADLEGARWLVKQAFGAVADAGVQQAFGGYVIGRISITASKTKLTRRLPRWAQEVFPDIRTLKGTYTMQTVWSTFAVRSASEVDELRVAIQPLTVAKPGSGISKKWAARVTRQMRRLDVIGSFVLAFGIEAGLSWYEDMQMRDIYGLTDQQIASRAALQGFGGLISAGMVAGLGYMAFGTVFPPVYVAVPVAMVGECLWEAIAVPYLYESTGLYGANEPRWRWWEGRPLIEGSPLL